MASFNEDPFLCDKCQSLGYCRVRAIQRQVDRLWSAQSQVGPTHMRQPNAGPVITLRQFVAEHHPELSRLLPRPADASTDSSPAKRPTLGELRAIIAARKANALPENPVAVEATAPEPLAKFTLSVHKSRIEPKSLRIDLKKLPTPSTKKRNLSGRPGTTSSSLERLDSLTSCSSLEI